ncbi:unnamed protein product [Caenorhabditis angaria]|uniref:Uncharacterized protein n=1 Tax=Caenorhabditis angaria TaxID=860376 RepID=A0A9P1IYV9_9PELO|nr:unnamed protein product [Caenorhabditis angaria]
MRFTLSAIILAIFLVQAFSAPCRTVGPKRATKKTTKNAGDTTRSIQTSKPSEATTQTSATASTTKALIVSTTSIIEQTTTLAPEISTKRPGFNWTIPTGPSFPGFNETITFLNKTIAGFNGTIPDPIWSVIPGYNETLKFFEKNIPGFNGTLPDPFWPAIPGFNETLEYLNKTISGFDINLPFSKLPSLNETIPGFKETMDFLKTTIPNFNGTLPYPSWPYPPWFLPDGRLPDINITVTLPPLPITAPPIVVNLNSDSRIKQAEVSNLQFLLKSLVDENSILKEKLDLARAYLAGHSETKEDNNNQ